LQNDGIVVVVCELAHCGALRCFDPAGVKPNYNPYRLDGLLTKEPAALTDLTCMQAALPIATHNSPFLPSGGETISNTHCTYPRRDGQVELA